MEDSAIHKLIIVNYSTADWDKVIEQTANLLLSSIIGSVLQPTACFSKIEVPHNHQSAYRCEMSGRLCGGQKLIVCAKNSNGELAIELAALRFRRSVIRSRKRYLAANHGAFR